MRTRTVIALFLLVAALAALAWWLDASRARPGPADRPLLPSFDAVRATRLEIAQGTERVLLEVSGSSWRVIEPFSRAAEGGAAEAVLEALQDARREVRSTNPESHARLGVDAASAIRVRVWDAEERITAEVLVGNGGADGKVLVRVEGEDEVVAAPGALRRYARPRAIDWIDRNVLRFDPTEVTEIGIERGEEVVTVAREGEGWKVVHPTPGPAAKAPCERIASVLGRLSLVDIPASEAGAGLDPPRFTVRVTLSSGVQHELEVGAEAPGGVHVRVAGSPGPVVIAATWVADLDKHDEDLREAAGQE